MDAAKIPINLFSVTDKRALYDFDIASTRQIADRNVALLNRIIYADRKILVKEVLLSFERLRNDAMQGNTVALCIVIDIETAISVAEFSGKAMKMLIMWMNGYTQEEIADESFSYRQDVIRTINRCVERIMDILLYCNPYIGELD